MSIKLSQSLDRCAQGSRFSLDLLIQTYETSLLPGSVQAIAANPDCSSRSTLQPGFIDSVHVAMLSMLGNKENRVPDCDL